MFRNTAPWGRLTGARYLSKKQGVQDLIECIEKKRQNVNGKSKKKWKDGLISS